jgi:hypothetical protein
MAENKSDQGVKDKMKKGMSEAGKGQGTGGDAGKGQHGHGADPGKLGRSQRRRGLRQ